MAEDIVAELERTARGSLKCRPISTAATRAATKESRARMDLDDLRKSLRALMWRKMGITRTAAGLDEAAVQVDHWCRYVLPHVFDDPAGWTMQNMLITAPTHDRRRQRAQRVARRPLPVRLLRGRSGLEPSHQHAVPERPRLAIQRTGRQEVAG